MFTLGLVSAAAEARGFTELSGHCALAIKHDRNCQALEAAWSAPTENANPVQPIDQRADRLLVSIRNVAQQHLDDGEEADAEHRRQIGALLTTIFPTGVVDVINLAYVEEIGAIDRILGVLKNKKNAALVTELGLNRKVNELAKVAVEYHAALKSEREKETVSWEQVRAARAAGNDLLLQAVVIILAKHRSSSEEDTAARQELLAPILEQHEAIGRYLSARRAVQDVDPQTGKVDPNAPPIGEPSGAAPSPAPAAAKPASPEKPLSP
ncbi:MAG: DUF6261 family protein [Polyangiaceae bacterium]